jgi:hypothetical protein
MQISQDAVSSAPATDETKPGASEERVAPNDAVGTAAVDPAVQNPGGNRDAGRVSGRKRGRSNRSNARELRPADPPTGEAPAREDESEDFTEEDLRRLRGEMPVAGKAKKKRRY